MPEETKVTEQPHSCKIAINAKGMYSGEVKVYAASAVDARVQAELQASQLARLIKEKNG